MAEDPWYPGGQRDARVWVRAFLDANPRVAVAGPAPDMLLGWFANAIETGVLLGHREAGTRADDARQAALDALYELRRQLYPLPLGENLDVTQGREDERTEVLRLIDDAMQQLRVTDRHAPDDDELPAPVEAEADPGWPPQDS